MLDGKVRAVLRLVTQADPNSVQPWETSTQTFVHDQASCTTGSVASCTVWRNKWPTDSGYWEWMEKLHGPYLVSTPPLGNVFLQGASIDISETLAATVRRMCTCYVDPSSQSVLSDYHLSEQFSIITNTSHILVASIALFCSFSWCVLCSLRLFT